MLNKEYIRKKKKRSTYGKIFHLNDITKLVIYLINF